MHRVIGKFFHILSISLYDGVFIVFGERILISERGTILLK